MKVFHRTTHATAILSHGFRDGTGKYLTKHEYTGVWVSDRPLDASEGAHGETLLSLDVPEDVLAEHEWFEEGREFREFLVPASILNRYGPPIVSHDDES